MSGGNDKPPPAPNPALLAQQQAQANRDTALTNFNLGQVNQSGPYGNLSYNQIGTNPDGTPRVQANYALNPELQGLYDKTVGALSSSVGSPFQLGNEATEARLAELGRARLDPMFDQKWGQQETTLMNRGIMPGTEQYDRARAAFGRDRNDAYNQLFLTGRGQAVSEALAERNQPLQEYLSITGSRPMGFNALPTPSATMQGTDVAGIYNNAYQNQLNAYGMENQQNNAMLGGLMGLGGTVIGGALGGPIGGWAGKQLTNYFGK